MSELESDALVLLDRLAAARASGATDHELADLVVRAGWRPLLADPDQDVLDGVLANGLHVPVRILRAS